MVVFGHADLLRNALVQLIDMGDDTDEAVSGCKLIEHFQSLIQHIRAESAESFIDKQSIQIAAAGMILYDIGEAQCKGQRGVETFAAGKQ